MHASVLVAACLLLAAPVLAQSPASRNIRSFKDADGQPVRCDGVADDSTGLAAAAAALRFTGASIHIPGDCRLLLNGAAQPWLAGVGLVGDGRQGSTILLGDRVNPALVVSSNWSARGIVWFWPGQTEAAAVANGGVPVAYPPLFAPHVTDGVADHVSYFAFENNQVENAYVIADFSAASAVGHYHWERNLEFALSRDLILRSQGGEGFITNNQSTQGAYVLGVLGTRTSFLRDYAAAHSEFMRITGDGTPSRIASTAVEGMRMEGNYLFGKRYGIRAVGGTLNIASLTDNTFDQVQTPVAAEHGGALFAVTWQGGQALCQRLGDPLAVAPCVSISGGAPGSTLTMANVQVAVAVGPGIVFDDSGVGAGLTILGGHLLNIGNVGLGNPYAGVEFNAPNGSLTLAGLRITSTAVANSAAARGVVLTAAKTSVLNAVTLGGWNVPLSYFGATGQHSVTASTSYGTTGPATADAIHGAGARVVVQAGNNFDVGSQQDTVRVPAGRTGGLGCTGPDADVDCRVTTQGAGRLVAQSSLGAYFVAQPSGAAAQVAYPLVQSASSGGSVTYTASAGNVIYAAPNYVLVPTAKIPPCSIHLAGYLCAKGRGAGLAVVTQ